MRALVVLVSGLVIASASTGCGGSDETGAPAQDGETGSTVAVGGSRGGPEQNFGVFQKPRTERDQLPRYAEQTAASSLGPYDVDPEESRFVSEREGLRLYAVPGPRDLCVFAENGAGSCATVEQATQGMLLTVQSGPPLGDDELRAWGAVPDGVKAVTVVLRDGTKQHLDVTRNAWVLRTNRGLRSIHWRGPDGKTTVPVPGG